jgi:hypothetical protein
LATAAGCCQIPVAVTEFRFTSLVIFPYALNAEKYFQDFFFFF